MKSKGLFKSVLFFLFTEHILFFRVNFYQLSVLEQSFLISALILGGVAIALFRARV